MARKKKSSKRHTKSPRKSSKRSSAAKRAAKTRHANALARSRRAKKAAATRKRRDRAGLTRAQRNACESPKKRKKSKSRKRRGPPCTTKRAEKLRSGRRAAIDRRIAQIEKRNGKNSERAQKQIDRLKKQLEAAEARKRSRRSRRRPHKKHRKHARRHGGRRHVARAFNPIHGWGQGLAATGGIVLGALVTILSDRFATSHALSAAPNGSGYADSPAQGQLYNADAPAAPIWSSWKRLAVAGADLVVPFGLSMATKKHPKTQTFFQAWLIAAGATIGGKTVMDLLVKVPMLNRGPKAARLFAPEITSKNALAVSKAGQLPAYALVQGGTGPQPGGGSLAAPGSNVTQHVPAPMLGDLAAPGRQPPGGGTPLPQNPAPNGPLPIPNGPAFGPPAGGGSLDCPPGMANVIPNGALPACASFVNPEDDENSGAPEGGHASMTS